MQKLYVFSENRYLYSVQKPVASYPDVMTLAMRFGQLDVLKYLVSQFGFLKEDHRASPCLGEAILSGELEVVRYVAEEMHGSISFRNVEGRESALVLAAKDHSGNGLAIFQYLWGFHEQIDEGKKDESEWEEEDYDDFDEERDEFWINWMDLDNNPPLYYALEYENTDIMEFILENCKPKIKLLPVYYQETVDEYYRSKQQAKKARVEEASV